MIVFCMSLIFFIVIRDLTFITGGGGGARVEKGGSTKNFKDQRGGGSKNNFKDQRGGGVYRKLRD